MTGRPSALVGEARREAAGRLAGAAGMVCRHHLPATPTFGSTWRAVAAA